MRDDPLACLWRSLLVLVVGSVGAAAADVRVVAPSAQGSGWDQLARTLKDAVADVDAKAAIEVVNVPGGNGAVGLSRFLADRSQGDVLVTGLTMIDALVLKRSALGMDRMTPLARLAAEYFAVVVPVASPYTSLAELRAAFQAEPSKVTWAGGPSGGIDHAAAALFAMTAGVAPLALNYVPFLTSGDAVAATVDGRVAAAFLSTVELDTALKDEKLRVLAVAAPRPLPKLAAPTLRESGLDLDFANWRGLLAQPDLPPGERQILERLVATLVASPRWRGLVEARGWEEAYLPPAAFASFILLEKARLKLALRSIGLLKTAGD